MIGIKKDEFKKLYINHLQLQEIKENDRTTNISNQTRHIEHHRDASRDIRRTVTARSDTGTFEHDSKTASRYNFTSIAHTENNANDAKRYTKFEEIKINHQLKNIKLKNYSHVKIIDDAYISEIKDMLKDRRKDDYNKIRNAYLNLHNQKYYYDIHKKKYNLPILNMMYDCFSRLFKFQKKSSQTEIIKPNVEPPLEKSQWQKLTREQQNTLRYACLYHYQQTFENLLQFNKINNIQDNNTFQSFLSLLKEKGDFMADEISNLYPYEYIKQLDDEYLKNELTKMEGSKNR